MEKKKNEPRGKICPKDIFKIANNGVVVDDKYYLDLHCSLRASVSKEEAENYSKRCKLLLPTEKQLEILAANIENVNHNLRLLGQQDYLLPANLKESFWFRGQQNKNADLRRKVLFIIPIH